MSGPIPSLCTMQWNLTGVGPCLKWVGGKRALLPELLARVPAQLGRYHEPFAGGLALFWRLRELGRLSTAVDGPGLCRAALSDSNPHLVNFYQVVRDDVGGLVEALSPLRYDRELFYEIRRRLNAGEGGPADRAAWFLLINKTGYNGLWRVNQRGGCNVPFGDYEDPTICDESNLQACSAALQGADVDQVDFAEAIRRARPGDFVYGDPPYVPLTATASFTGYCAGGFRMADQVRLRDAAAEARRRGVHVLLSNSSAPAVLELYAGWKVELVDARRSVSCRAGGRGAVKEVLIS